MDSSSVSQLVTETSPPSKLFAASFFKRYCISDHESTRFKIFWDKTGGQWQKGAFANKFAGVFVSTSSLGGGQESTAIAALSTLAHHGIIYVPLGYSRVFSQLTDLTAVHGGSPWGAGTVAVRNRHQASFHNTNTNSLHRLVTVLVSPAPASSRLPRSKARASTRLSVARTIRPVRCVLLVESIKLFSDTLYRYGCCRGVAEVRPRTHRRSRSRNGSCSDNYCRHDAI